MSLKVAFFAVVVVVLAGVGIVQHIGESMKSQEIRPPTADERAELRALGKIVFIGDGDDTRPFEGVLTTMNGDGSGKSRFTAGAEASWSPDGKRIAFTRWAPRGNGYDAQFVFVMRADGGRAQKLARGTSPDWSPDGARIAFAREEGRRGRERDAVWVMRANGSGAHRLWQGSSPAWSPDGRRIAFDRGGFLGEGGSLWVSDVGEGRPRRLADAWGPAWSRDGKWILASILEDEDDVFLVRGNNLALVDPESRDVERLAGKSGLLGGGPNVDSAAWSPDGKWIVFSCDPNDICVTRSGWGHDWLRIADSQLGTQPDPDWQARS